MRRILGAAAGAAVSLLFLAAPAQAARVTFVSQLTGSDSYNCTSPASPCATLSGAYGKTEAGGVMHVLPGEYSSLEITQSVKIIADGGQASITSSAIGGVNMAGAFYVNAGAADDVLIRGFTLRGGSGLVVGAITGISFVAAGALYVENCTLADSEGNYGILFVPTGASELYVSNSVAYNNSSGGILIKPAGAGSVKAVLDNVSVEDNGSGITIDGRSTTADVAVTIRNTTVAGSTNYGLNAIDSGGGATSVVIEGSTFSNNGTQGVISNGANTTVRMRNSTVTGNARGIIFANSGKLISGGGNLVRANTINGAFTATEAQQ